MNKRKLIEKEAKRDYGKILAYTKIYIARNHHEAEDLVSEAYLKFFDSLDRGKNKYEPNTNFVNYLMFIVKNIAIDSVGRFGGAGVGAKIGSFFLPPFGTKMEPKWVHFGHFCRPKLVLDAPGMLHLEMSSSWSLPDSILERLGFHFGTMVEQIWA